LFALSAVLGLLLAGGQKQELRLAAAADLSSVVARLAPEFEKETGIHIDVSLGSSGNFFAQISNGAPFDVFMSADKSYPEKLAQAGLGEPGTLANYARGKLVLWSSRRALLSADRNLEFLADRSVQRIAIANPEHAPYGRAALAVLKHFGIYDRVKDKLVLGENISQTAQFAQSGNADAAFIAYSLALTESMKQKGSFTLLPEESYPPLDQASIVVRSSRNKEAARRFLAFLTSEQGRAILRAGGFEVPGK
jgi:molybdate transport system substrate-binding protein